MTQDRSVHKLEFIKILRSRIFSQAFFYERIFFKKKYEYTVTPSTYTSSSSASRKNGKNRNMHTRLVVIGRKFYNIKYKKFSVFCSNDSIGVDL